MIEIRLANSNDYINVRNFYYSLIAAMASAEYKPGWKKDIYPTKDFLVKSIKSKELFVGLIDGCIVSCMVLNHEYNESYKNVQWSVETKDSELFVIHALGVHPAFSGKGIAKQMVQKAIETAQKNDAKTIRLDVLLGNFPAVKTYKKMGFNYIDTIQMFYEDTGWTQYELFEYMI